MKIIGIILMATLIAAASAQAPPQILAMDDLPNAGQLYLNYCVAGDHRCVGIKAICYGQCCDQATADQMGYGCSGNIEGHVPHGYHYAGWSCRTFDKGKQYNGLATKGYDKTGCHNPR